MEGEGPAAAVLLSRHRDTMAGFGLTCGSYTIISSLAREKHVCVNNKMTLARDRYN